MSCQNKKLETKEVWEMKGTNQLAIQSILH